jgi:hypothetical protein
VKRGFVAALSVLALCGCPSDDINEVKKNLGAFQYIGLDPQLAFTIQKADFEPARNDYAPPTVNYSVVVKQHNSAFPLTQYSFNATAQVMDGSGAEMDDVMIAGKIEGGVAAVSEIRGLYGLRKKSALDIAKWKLQVKNYNWFPILQRKPFVPSSGKSE